MPRVTFRFWSVSLILALVVMTMVAANNRPYKQTTTDTDNADGGAVGVSSPFDDINADYQSVRPIFERSCFDCHSTLTSYPWYHALPLIGGMIDNHVEEGRAQLDLSNDFPFIIKGSQQEMLEEIRHEIEENKMPLRSYRLIHWGTRVDGAERDSVFAWIDRSLARLSQSGAESAR